MCSLWKMKKKKTNEFSNRNEIRFEEIKHFKFWRSYIFVAIQSFQNRISMHQIQVNHRRCPFSWKDVASKSTFTVQT